MRPAIIYVDDLSECPELDCSPGAWNPLCREDGEKMTREQTRNVFRKHMSPTLEKRIEIEIGAYQSYEHRLTYWQERPELVEMAYQRWLDANDKLPKTWKRPDPREAVTT